MLGASSYVYAEACPSQDVTAWITAHVRMVEFFGGAPALFVPDNLLSGVTKACRYEPVINRTCVESPSTEAVYLGYAPAQRDARDARPPRRRRSSVALRSGAGGSPVSTTP